MKSTGEVMAIGRCFEEAFLKAWASLEYGLPHPRPLTMADASGGETMDEPGDHVVYRDYGLQV